MKLSHAALGAVGMVLAANVSTAVQAAEYVIAISQDIASKEARRLIGASAMAFLFSPQVKLGDRVTVVNASDLSQVARFVIPEHPQYKNEASRRKHLEKPTAEFTRFLAKAPEGTGEQVAASINVPRIFEEVAATVPAGSEGKFEMLVIGNPIYADMAQPRFSMAGGRVPSDGHLLAAIEESVFGLQGGGTQLQGARVHWVTVGADWKSDLHEIRVKRMWAAYVEQRGGQLASFKNDVKSVFDQFGTSSLAKVKVEPPLDRSDQRLAMHIVRRDEENRAVEPLFESKEVRRAPVAMLPAQAKLRIGIRWQCGARCDVDVYAKTVNAKKWIYFGEPETAEGQFFKYDVDPSKPAKGFEYIEFKSAVDLKQVVIAVNFYEGEAAGGPRGQLRFDLGGAIHEVDFHIQCPRGNKGIGFPDRMGRHACWVLVKAADIADGKLKFAGPP